MELNLTSCLRAYNRTSANIATALKIDNPDNTRIAPFITNRTLIIFKLELILFYHREEFDKERKILSGTNALTHYLFYKKNVPISDARNIRLHDAIVILCDEINRYVIPSDVINFIIEHGDNYSSADEDISQITERFSSYINSEWDANFADELLRQ
ncbi:hypothetical protein LES60_07080 [Pectobacterium brasiliense]|uniref:ECs1072 family phage-associated protein n=1 Tax=Pectobacterium brasiliense TaxID=180957 RepID=UPI00196914A1|nr:hypothetical protein [Pectobacterium brasiliense]MBN3207514.1 hypothetical protein [Pectobacterium brasiliense]MCA5919198.1 hypothetical protein [Pectobacterium brasiliense]MCA5926415.1 hypothetical protein [Pectobacterium brasiliense]MCA5935569.1 hypothetical protein [Pectobacterium brasiliense]MCA5941500.1 hypothetical protein [Pectobacterium brasiliense]